MAIEKARNTGIGWVNSQFSNNHARPASLYRHDAARHDMIGLYFAVGNANHLPPGAASTCCLSDQSDRSGPFRPATKNPIVLDMRRRVAAYGKSENQGVLRGETMPEAG